MSSLAEQQAAMTKDKAKITKLFVALKKLMSKEFLWILFALILGLPLALVCIYLLSVLVPDTALQAIDKLLAGTPRFNAAFTLCLAGIYFTRTIVGSIKTLAKKEGL